jgi:hypothetical protein
MRRVRRALPLLAAAVLLAGCGNDETRAPDVSRAGPPGDFERSQFSRAGVVLRTPRNWRIRAAAAPQVVTISDGAAQVAVWRYPRSEPLPSNRPQLQSARDELVKAVKQRDAQFRVTNTRIVVKPGLRGVEIIGVGTNQGVRRKVRSLHAYGQRGEVVVDAYAPVEQFDRVDEQTFAPLARSLRLRKPRS